MKNIKNILKCFICLTLILFVVLLPFSAFAEEAEEETTEVEETEKNNKLKNADKITVGGSITGKLSSESDVDWYKVATVSDGDILVNFTHEGDGVYAYYWYITVYDSDKKTVLNEGTLSGKEPTDFTIEDVKKGTYYFKISKISGGNPLTNGFTKANYTIAVTTSCTTHGELLPFEDSVSPSCTEPGEKIQKCSVCNTTVVTENIEKLGHSYNEWSIVEEAGTFNIGEKKSSCVLCGDVKTEMYMAASMIILLVGIGVAILALIIFISIKKKRSRHSYSSYSSYSSGSSSYSSGGSSYSGSSYSSSDYSYSGSSSSYDDMPTSVYNGPYVSSGGMDYSVHYTDAEGYSTSGYYEDAEGYKHSTDGMDIQEFNWLDL